MEKSLQASIDSKYGHKSTAMRIANGLSITGKSVVITSGYAGTGFETTKAFSKIATNIISIATRYKESKNKSKIYKILKLNILIY
jgi:hypothetical protein